MTDSPIPLTAVIPTYGRAALLARTLDSLAACPTPLGYGGTLVVENGPKDAAEGIVAAAAERHPGLGLRYLHVAQANKSAALNAALADDALGGLVVFFDDDLRVAPELLEAYATAAAAHAEGGALFGGPMSVDYEQAPPSWLVEHLPFSARGVEFDQRPRPDYFMGCNWAAFADDVRAAGGFAEDFGPGSPTGATGQESEMQRRMKRAGIKRVYVPDARVWHYVPRERCSPQWTLGRKYKAGIEKGTYVHTRTGHRQLWQIREYTGASVRALTAWAKAKLRGNPADAFTARVALRKSTGFIVGYLFR